LRLIACCWLVVVGRGLGVAALSFVIRRSPWVVGRSSRVVVLDVSWIRAHAILRMATDQDSDGLAGGKCHEWT